MSFDLYEERLLEGSSLNVVGLSGSGRSQWLDRFERHLEESGWTCRRWSLAHLRAMTRQEMKAAVDALRRHAEMAVLLIDDFGEFLVEASGQWLERLLFSAIHESGADEDGALRVVVVTTPRDREIVGPASVLRERCLVAIAAPDDVDEVHIARLGWSSANEVEHFTGLSTHLVPNGGGTPQSERGLLQRRCNDLLPRLVGQLDGGLHRRLGTVLRRSSASRWRTDEGDRSLRPLAICRTEASGPACVVPAVVNRDELRALLLSERWPERDVRRSARRFAARCGNEPSPIWTDNYLSDTKLLDFRALAEFLEEVMRYRPVGTTLRLLSRDRVGGTRASPGELSSTLLGAGVKSDVVERLEWRIYDRRGQVNLHQRELSLPRRGAGFSLPTAQMIVGQVPIGNESDAELALFANRPTQETWNNATPVPLTGGES